MAFEIAPFSEQIRNFNPADQVIGHSRILANWTRHYQELTWLQEILSSLYDDNRGGYYVSRGEIFDTADETTRLVKLIYWGYPKGIYNIPMILYRSSDIIRILPNYNTKLTREEFHHLYQQLDDIKGLGISTISKILYFWGISVGASQCVIVDKNVLECRHLFDEFGNIPREMNAENYLQIIKKINRIATDIHARPDQVEYFLFNVGKIISLFRKSSTILSVFLIT